MSVDFLHLRNLPVFLPRISDRSFGSGYRLYTYRAFSQGRFTLNSNGRINRYWNLVFNPDSNDYDAPHVVSGFSRGIVRIVGGYMCLSLFNDVGSLDGLYSPYFTRFIIYKADVDNPTVIKTVYFQKQFSTSIANSFDFEVPDIEDIVLFEGETVICSIFNTKLGEFSYTANFANRAVLEGGLSVYFLQSI